MRNGFPQVIFSSDTPSKDNPVISLQEKRIKDKKEGRDQRVIAIASGKGGVGKSVIAANMGLRLAQMGRRVLMVDADLALANLDLMLGVSVEHTIRDIIDSRHTLDEVLATGPEGVSLLPACSGDENFANMTNPERLALFSAIDALEDRFDTLIVDTGAGIGSNAVGFAAAAEQVLIVVTPDPASIADAYAMIKVLNRRGRKRFNLVVNLATSPSEADRVVDRMLTLVDQFMPDVALIPVGILYRDEVVLRAVRSCNPVINAFPRSGVASGIKALTDRLLREPTTDSADTSQFWQRLVGTSEDLGES